MCTLRSLVLAKKSCNNISNSRAQVSRLCYFLWLCSNQIFSVLFVMISKWACGFTFNPCFILFKWRLKRKYSPAKCVIRTTEIRRMEIHLEQTLWSLILHVLISDHVVFNSILIGLLEIIPGKIYARQNTGGKNH